MISLISDERRFLVRLYACLLDDMQTPVSVEEYRTHRLVRVLGCIRVRVEPKRHRFVLKALTWPANGWEGGGEFMLARGFSTPHFLDAWLRLQYVRYDRHGDSERQMLQNPACRKRLTAVLFRRVKKRPEYRRLKVAARVAVFADAHVRGVTMAMALQVPPTHEHYALVWKHFEVLQAMHRAQPRLFPLLSLLPKRGLHVDRLLEDGFGTVRRLLLDQGLRPLAWRMMAKHGVRFWRPLKDDHGFHELSPQTLVQYGNMLAYCRRSTLPPPGLAKAWAGLGVLQCTDAARSSRIWPIFLAAWRHVEHLPDKRQRLDFIRREFVPALHEWAGLVKLRTPVTLVPLPWNVTWQGVMRRLQSYNAGMYAETLSDRPWPVSGPTRIIDGYEISPLKNQQEAFRVGLALRNCFSAAPDYGSSLVGRRPHFVIRREGKILALLALSARGGIHDLREACNSRARESIQAAVRKYLIGLRQQMESFGNEDGLQAVKMSRKNG